MWICPVCEKEYGPEPVCPNCGFDETKNYTAHRPLGRLAPEACREAGLAGNNNLFLKELAAAEKGDVGAMFMIAVFYHDGYRDSEHSYEVPPDAAKSAKWCKKAAEGGNPYAACMLGDYYRLGFGVEKSIPKAIRWYEAAVERGSHDAQAELKKLRK